jgi:pimeloyl-ACP methyl ester carboxylesterase
MTSRVAVVHHFVEVNDTTLHYVEGGDGDLIVFLHGFPQCWYAWRHQLAEFSGDHLVVAPDMRGYNLSDKPSRVADYGIHELVADVRELAERVGDGRPFVLVGHDWGGIVAWAFALYHPELLEKLVIVTTSHPRLLDRALKQDPDQQEASQLSLILRAPGSEDLMRANDYGALETEILSLPFYTDEDRAVYREAWHQPGALTGGVNYYRAARLGPPGPDGSPANGNYVPDLEDQTVRVPTLMIYAEASRYMRPSTLDGLEQLVPRLTVRRVPRGNHWLAEEQPELVNTYIREFLESGST